MLSYLGDLLLRRDPRTIRLSSMSDTISEVSEPLSSSSPLFLNEAKLNSCVLQSVMTPFSFASMSRSFTAAMQMSWGRGGGERVNQSIS